jgi:hypothetical protein
MIIVPSSPPQSRQLSATESARTPAPMAINRATANEERSFYDREDWTEEMGWV